MGEGASGSITYGPGRSVTDSFFKLFWDVKVRKEPGAPFLNIRTWKIRHPFVLKKIINQFLIKPNHCVLMCRFKGLILMRHIYYQGFKF